MMRTGLMAITAAGLLAVAGCGEKRETGTGSGAAQAGGAAMSTVKVSETEFKLTPSAPKVAKAGAIEFQVKNDGTTEHALEVVTPDGEVKTAPIAPGKSATLKADLKAGTYQWYCPIDGHRDKGMKGQVVVAGGGGGSSNGGGGGYSRGGGY
jgi:uncharacterized cupredoxin-like copper-binding protein